MKIKMLKTLATPVFSAAADQMIEVDEKTAQALVDAEAAVLVSVETPDGDGEIASLDDPSSVRIRELEAELEDVKQKAQAAIAAAQKENSKLRADAEKAAAKAAAAADKSKAKPQSEAAAAGLEPAVVAPADFQREQDLTDKDK